MDPSSKTQKVYRRATEFTSRVFDDLKQSDIQKSLRRDLKDTYRFYLSEETRDELQTMGRVRRGFYSSWYLLQSLFFKLAPTRRWILLLGVLVTLFGLPDESGKILFGLLSVLFVLGLELKDKLLAKDELEEGRAVQIALMPTSNPELPGWEIWLFTTPANDVGGDLVDSLKLDDERMALSLGDVAGKGLSAALMMAKLQATIRALATSTESTTDLGERLNTIFCRDGLPSKFASLIYLEMNANSGELAILNAGHLPPIILRPESLEELPHGAPAIGLSPRSSYRSHTADLSPGDMMIVYSDGLTEARNEIGRFFGDDRLRSILKPLRGLSAGDAGNRILDAVKNFEQGAPQNDDLSIILIKRLQTEAGSSALQDDLRPITRQTPLHPGQETS